ncbi:alpha/beta hydrolase [Aquabacterium sp. J223]|uniref:alpha/beta hydrolase n=1 Tax=Aquabacterium sp. J223 TaxID=2898431 RepID=UPI0021AD8158|nr:alpha/beta hydrolase fold domain-containing protein [Aquabacterium sp. J223]UUX95408.1 alpha/beta hydrolase fold domain-containing protein [Aquabacterium sp. J223]
MTIAASPALNPHLAWPALPAGELAARYDNNADERNRRDLQALRERALQAHATRSPTRHRFGVAGWAVFDLYRPPPSASRGSAPPPLLVFVHGGRWRLNTSRETAYWAEAARAEGWALAVLNQPKLNEPEVRLSAIVDAVEHGLDAVCALAPTLEVDAGRLGLAGHSSGAHLALAATQAAVARKAAWLRGLRRLLLVSGLYDLRPLLAAHGEADAGFTAAEAQSMSPLLQAEARPLPVPAMVAVGEQETSEFVRQSRALHWALARGPAGAVWQPVPGAAHFDIADDFDTPASPLRGFLREGLR